MADSSLTEKVRYFFISNGTSIRNLGNYQSVTSQKPEKLIGKYITQLMIINEIGYLITSFGTNFLKAAQLNKRFILTFRARKDR